MESLTDLFWEEMLPVVSSNDGGASVTLMKSNGRTVKLPVDEIIKNSELQQTPEQFYLTAAKMHLELAKEFYVLSQGESNTVVKGDDVFPKVTIVDDNNVESVRTQWAKQMEVGFVVDET